jgi:predicted RNase H-like nuclease (RuvC/YqgF family)
MGLFFSCDKERQLNAEISVLKNRLNAREALFKQYSCEMEMLNKKLVRFDDLKKANIELLKTIQELKERLTTLENSLLVKEEKLETLKNRIIDMLS